MSQEKMLTFCQHCHMKCRLFVTVKEGKIQSIKNAMGIEGIKGIHCKELIDHSDRLIYPKKRTVKRGEGQWARISWDEALDMMAERFGAIKKRYGPEAVATILGCGHKEPAYYATFLFSHVLGTPNVMDINRQCSIPTMIGSTLTFGENLLTELEPDFLRSRCILIWGANPKHTYPPLDRDICIAQEKGAKIIIIDPRPPGSVKSRADQNDLWLRIKPGSDAFLALAMIKVLIDEKLYEEDFVAKWCIGFEALKDHVQKYTLEEAERITSVPRDKIIEAVRTFSTTKPSCLYTRLGSSAQHINATQSARAISIFFALSGSIDVPGGNLLGNPLEGYRHQRTMSQWPSFPPGVEEKRLGADTYPFICSPRGKMDDFLSLRRAHGPDCIEAMIDGKIKAFYAPGCNVVVGESNSRRIREALRNLDFFVVADLFMTPTAELADLVLPAAHFLETALPMRAYQRMGPNLNTYILASRRVVDPRGECWDDRKIIFELAKRMDAALPWDDVEAFNDWTLEGVGVTFKEIQSRRSQQLSFPVAYVKYETNGFKTPSDKIELYSETLENMGYDFMPLSLVVSGTYRARAWVFRVKYQYHFVLWAAIRSHHGRPSGKSDSVQNWKGLTFHKESPDRFCTIFSCVHHRVGRAFKEDGFRSVQHFFMSPRLFKAHNESDTHRTKSRSTHPTPSSLLRISFYSQEI
ncbi:molybdopterin-dependent oxidoreductase [bacterium]|nr:molybdopterin-dependent oxidoreductase [bacterium]